MTTQAIRKKLQDFIANMDAERVQGMYLLLKPEIESEPKFRLSKRQLEILDEERDLHIKGISKSFSLEESLTFAKGS